MATKSWKPSDTKTLLITVIGGVAATVVASIVLERMGKQ